MSIATAKRRRRQAKNGYSHVAKLGRPVYHKKSPSKAARDLQKRIQNEHARRQRGAKF